jgi:hypothetical protein
MIFWGTSMVRDEQHTLCFEKNSKVDEVKITEPSVLQTHIPQQRHSATIITLKMQSRPEASHVDDGSARLLEKIARRAKLF